MNATLAAQLPAIINSLVVRSTSETLTDGTITFHASKLSLTARQIFSVMRFANEERDTRTETIYTSKGENYDWSVVMNRTSSRIRFTLNDYTAPLAAEEAAKAVSSTTAEFDKLETVIGAPEHGLKVEREDKRDGYSVYYITWGDRGRISVPVDTKMKHASFHCDANVSVHNLNLVMRAQVHAMKILQSWEKHWASEPDAVARYFMIDPAGSKDSYIWDARTLKFSTLSYKMSEGAKIIRPVFGTLEAAVAQVAATYDIAESEVKVTAFYSK